MSADGARPRLARVGDVIEHGQDIPANVVRFTDRDRRIGEFWQRSSADPSRYVYFADGNYGDATPPDFIRSMPKWWPMTVVEVEVEVEVEPQPAERVPYIGERTSTGSAEDFPQPAEDDRLPERQCANEARHGGHAWGGAFGKVRCPGYVGRAGVPVPVEDPADSAIVDELVAALHVEPDQIVAEVEALRAALYEARQPAESGPLVLTLPVVPDGAVALVDRIGRRWTRSESGANWEQRDPDGVLSNWRSLGNLLGDFGPLTVEMAAPREPRIWPQVDDDETDLPALVKVERDDAVEIWSLNRAGGRYVRDGRSPHLKLVELRTLGEVTEVLA